MTNNFAVLILAAGLAKRYGKNKLLEKISVNGKEISIIEQVIKSFNQERISKIIMVLSPKYGESIKLALKRINDLKVSYIENLNPEHGMSHSVRLGLENLIDYHNKSTNSEFDIDYLIITPADFPGYTKKLILEIIEGIDELNADIMIPTYKSRRGHPLIVSMDLISELLSINEQTQGMKGFLRNNQQKIVEFPSNNINILRDLDEKKDLKQIKRN